jgi:hypothetical protein
MIRYECDYCNRLKEEGETWILGFAAEIIGARVEQREVTILSNWDEARAVERLAVHLCSDRCRREYTSTILGDIA